MKTAEHIHTFCECEMSKHFDGGSGHKYSDECFNLKGIRTEYGFFLVCVECIESCWYALLEKGKVELY